MTEPPNVPSEEGSRSKPDEAPTESTHNKTMHERLLEEIATNPKWRDTTKPGRAFVIGGVKPPSDGPLGGRSETGENIRAALERAGVAFIDANGGWPGVRLRKSPHVSKRK